MNPPNSNLKSSASALLAAADCAQAKKNLIQEIRGKALLENVATALVDFQAGERPASVPRRDAGLDRNSEKCETDPDASSRFGACAFGN
jgi:hypothetical protein